MHLWGAQEERSGFFPLRYLNPHVLSSSREQDPLEALRRHEWKTSIVVRILDFLSPSVYLQLGWYYVDNCNLEDMQRLRQSAHLRAAQERRRWAEEAEFALAMRTLADASRDPKVLCTHCHTWRNPRGLNNHLWHVEGAACREAVQFAAAQVNDCPGAWLKYALSGKILPDFAVVDGPRESRKDWKVAAHSYDCLATLPVRCTEEQPVAMFTSKADSCRFGPDWCDMFEEIPVRYSCEASLQSHRQV